MFITAAGLFARGARWRLLTSEALGRIEAAGIIGIGYLLSNLLPLRLGDIGKALVTSWRVPVSVAASLSAMVVERALDLLTVALLLLMTLPFIPALASARMAGLVAVVGTMGGLLAFVALLRFDFDHLPWPRRFRPWLERLSALQAELRSLGAWRRWPPLLFWTAMTWGCVAVAFALVLRAFGIDALLGGVVVTWATAFGMALPAPGGIGTFHEAIRLVLTKGFALPDEVTVAYAIVAHLVNYLLGSLFGIVALARWGLSPTALTAAARARVGGEREGE